MLLEYIICTILFFLYGIIIGSFLNVCIYRIPKKENLAKTRSHCMECGHNLAWYDLFPLFSWLFLGGKCRYCKSKISKQYPLVEFINGAGYVWVYAVHGLSVESILYCLLFSALVVLAVIDWRTFEIPVGINWFIFALGVIATLVDLEHMKSHLIGMVSMWVFFAILYYGSGGRAMGGGDLKLMTAAGLLLGWQNIWLALVLGCVIGSVVHIARMKLSGQEHMLAFGPYLACGITLAMLYGEPMIDWYLTLYGIPA